MRACCMLRVGVWLCLQVVQGPAKVVLPLEEMQGLLSRRVDSDRLTFVHCYRPNEHLHYTDCFTRRHAGVQSSLQNCLKCKVALYSSHGELLSLMRCSCKL